MTPADLLAHPAPDTWWLDHGRRNHRLIRDGDCVVAEHRSGRAFRVPWPEGEPMSSHEAFAARLFNIAKKAVERPAASDR